jgi:hypothetical protein
MLAYRVINGCILLGLALFVSGCASYYTHYGAFTAANSAGEPRQFRVTWQTAEYPGWWLSDDKATPITLETQCSNREWRLESGVREEGDNKAPSCGLGIVACGEADNDILAASGQPATAKDRCMEVTNAQRITELDNSVNLSVQCRPADTEVIVDDETQNRDYLRASVVPYEISVKKAKRNSLYSRPPQLGERVCDTE